MRAQSGDRALGLDFDHELSISIYRGDGGEYGNHPIDD